jgi:hypothetical protein
MYPGCLNAVSSETYVKQTLSLVLDHVFSCLESLTGRPQTYRLVSSKQYIFQLTSYAHNVWYLSNLF